MTRTKFSAAVLTVLAACARTLPPTTVPQISAPPAPAPARAEWMPLIGEYDTPRGMRLVLEDSGSLWFADTVHHSVLLREQTETTYGIDAASAERLLGKSGDRVVFVRPSPERANEAVIGDTRFPRRDIEPAAGTNQLRITPVRPVEELRAEALRASPPAEAGQFRKPDLVEIQKLDPSIHLEIRYATTNNFLGTRFYEQARAFMQRPAAEAVVRAHQSLRALGFGLLIHDAYRPWFVTKMFWDATPLDKRWLVANPVPGSRHNRGEAVDLTLYDLRTGLPVEMPSTYDESTDRAYADYPGGTSLQRWRRAVLRRAMEAQGFIVNPTEWWHFDYKDWREYPIGNVPFSRLGS